MRFQVIVIQLEQHSLAPLPTKTTSPSFGKIWQKLPLKIIHLRPGGRCGVVAAIPSEAQW